MVVLLTLLAIFFPSALNRLPSQATRSVIHVTSSGPRRIDSAPACEVEAPSAYVEDVRKAWCGNDLIAKVSLKTDTRNYVGQVQLSGSGATEWLTATDASMTRFQSIVDGIAEMFRMNVAITLKSPDGAILGACRRDLIAVAATCSAR